MKIDIMEIRTLTGRDNNTYPRHFTSEKGIIPPSVFKLIIWHYSFLKSSLFTAIFLIGYST